MYINIHNDIRIKMILTETGGNELKNDSNTFKKI